MTSSAGELIRLIGLSKKQKAEILSIQEKGQVDFIIKILTTWHNDHIVNFMINSDNSLVLNLKYKQIVSGAVTGLPLDKIVFYLDPILRQTLGDTQLSKHSKVHSLDTFNIIEILGHWR